MMTHLPATRSSDAPQAFRDAHQRQARGIHVKRDRLRGGVERDLLRRRDLVHLRRHSDLVRVVTLPLCIHRLNLHSRAFSLLYDQHSHAETTRVRSLKRVENHSKRHKT